jgi:hypothetical protein
MPGRAGEDCVMDAIHSPSVDSLASRQLLQLINSYRVTQAIYVLATLGLPDIMGDGVCCSRELSETTRCNADALYRMLRALAAVGVMKEHPCRKFSLTELGQLLRSDVAGSRTHWARFVARPPMWAAWGQLLHTVRTGENAFRHVHGKDTWQFRADESEESQIFDAAMREGTARSAEEILAHYDFNQCDHIVDVGGGDGTLLAAILSRFPDAKGTLLDLSHVVAGANAIFAQAGVEDRASVVGGSFFDEVPRCGSLYLLKHIVHDWQDAEAIAILRACRHAAAPDAKIILVERVMGASNQAADATFADLNMMVNAGGRERTREQFIELLTAADLKLTALVVLPGPNCILEAICL